MLKAYNCTWFDFTIAVKMCHAKKKFAIHVFKVIK